ncbi:hypothetical protein HaLaN_08067 [Haematococcus lacustris]|uniref:Uncharacterized protein n=1 Tax=Haematococcus lacustris TaxID=44745 RepID=A0A699YR73_HAELA|nr:hypothetical protein HaLaN_08067 [Haematococcus lacustris]
MQVLATNYSASTGKRRVNACRVLAESMPARAIADTPQLLITDSSSGGVGGPSLGMLCIDIAANAGNVRLSLSPVTQEKGPPSTKRHVVS